MFIHNLKELIAWYNENKIPHDVPLDCLVELQFNIKTRDGYIKISQSHVGYGLDFHHFDTPQKQRDRIDDIRVRYLSHGMEW